MDSVPNLPGKVEHSAIPGILMGVVSKLTRLAAGLALVLYGMASFHCILEGVPGLDFLRTCCFVGAGSSATTGCDNDECAVESAKYRAEEPTFSLPQPPLIEALAGEEFETPLPEPRAAPFVVSEAPPEVPKIWPFSQRTALLPRAPSVSS